MNLTSLMERWEEAERKGATVCQQTGQHLLSEALRRAVINAQELARKGYCTDPLPTPQMYFIDAKGKRRTIRGSSGLEGRHRYMAEELPGVIMGPETAHLYTTLGQFRWLVNARNSTRPAEFVEYPTFRHDLLEKVNSVATKLHPLGVQRPPFPGIIRSAPNITEDDYTGGLKGHPLVYKRQLANDAAMGMRASKGKYEAPPSGSHVVAIEALPTQSKESTVHENVDKLASMPSQTGIGNPRAHMARAAASKVPMVVALLSPSKRQKTLENQASQSSNPAPPSLVVEKPVSATAIGSPRSAAMPIRMYRPVKPEDPEHTQLFHELLAKHTEASKSKPVDFTSLAASYNVEVSRRVSQGTATNLALTSGVHLRAYYKNHVEKPISVHYTQKPTLDLCSPGANTPKAEDAGIAGATGSGGSLVATASRAISSLSNWLGSGNAPNNESAKEVKGKNSHGTSKKACRACVWKEGKLVHLNETHKKNCPNQKLFQELTSAEQKRVNDRVALLKKQHTTEGKSWLS